MNAPRSARAPRPSPAAFPLLLATLLWPVSATAGVFDGVEKRLVASDATSDAQFGNAVAVSGDLAIVGAKGNRPSEEGAAYVFERNEGGPDNWGEVKKLTASDGSGLDIFGDSVAISGDTAIVGASFQLSRGAAYVFQRDAGGPDNWGEVAKLTASDPDIGDFFGWSVAISGDTAIVGAINANIGSTDPGAAYIYERDAGGPDSWGQVAKLTASDAGVNDDFGSGVAIDGDTAIVGARRQDGGGSSNGAAYLFERNEGGPDNWGETKKLVASDASGGSAFGAAVALHSGTVVLGAPEDDGQDGNEGAVYVYERESGGPDNWGEITKLESPEPDQDRRFGQSVGISGDRVIVGSRDDDRAQAAGAAYVHLRDEGGPDNWGVVKKLTASDAGAFHGFGVSVAIDGVQAIVGASNGGANPEDSGTAYVYEDGAVCESGPAVCTDTWDAGSLLVNELVPGRERFRAVFSKGPALTQTDLGTPLALGGSQYTVCIYDDASQLLAQLEVSRAAGACRDKLCWRPKGGDPPSGSGYQYKDPNRSADGLKQISLKGGPTSKIILAGDNKAAKGRTSLPTGIAAGLSGSASATVQLHGHDLGQCFSLTYDRIKVATGLLFKAVR